MGEGPKARRQPDPQAGGRDAVRPPRQSVQNIISYEPDTGTAFIRQIATELGVDVSDISDMPPEDDDSESDAETKVLAS